MFGLLVTVSPSPGLRLVEPIKSSTWKQLAVSHTVPEQGRNHPNDYHGLAEEEAKARPRNHGERDVELGACGTIEYKRNGDRHHAEEQAVDCFAPYAARGTLG